MICCLILFFFFFKQKTAYEMRISDWSSDVCSSDLFTADERVDFRQLVRALERRFSTRVHMWHIGVRDEARRLDGIGRCGRQFCSSSWLDRKSGAQGKSVSVRVDRGGRLIIKT